MSADAPALTGGEVHFVALADGTLIVDEDEPDDSLAPLADAIERQIRPPYRAVAQRTGEGSVWTATARRIDVAQLPAGAAGEWIELTVVGGERRLSVDGKPASDRTPELDALGAARSPDFALTAERLDDTTWEVEVSPL